MAEQRKDGSESTAIATVDQAQKSLSARIAERFGTDKKNLIDALKLVAFKNAEITTPQLVGLMIVADQYKLNPFTRELHAYPDKQGGIVPIVGVDGWTRIMNENPNFDGIKFRQSEDISKIDKDAKSCPEWIEAVIYRKDRQQPIVVREYLDESYKSKIQPKGKNYFIETPWQTHTKRMLRNKALIQGARIAFGYAGIYDPDEGQDILQARKIEAEIIDGPEIVEPREPEKPAISQEAQNAGVKEPSNITQPPDEKSKRTRRKKSGEQQVQKTKIHSQEQPTQNESGPESPPLAEPGQDRQENFDVF